MQTKRLTIKQRKEIFLALVTTQDEGNMSNADSLRFVSRQFGIDENQLRQIVDEGIDRDWIDEPALEVN